jgi:UDP-N-acetylglucosamine 2-epimerase (non-hydrolysing)
LKSDIKLLIVAGARPNFMKVAPLIKAANAHNHAAADGQARFQCRLVHTGQHYDPQMSDVFFRELGIPAPNVNLGVGSGSHATQTANIILGFEPVCLAEKPDWVVVVGDVNSTMACSIVAAKLAIRVAHVEAGLRSFDRTMPEEINRLLTDSISDLLLTPSPDADENLRREGISPEKIERVGNIMIDALVENLPQARKSAILGRLGLAAGGFLYVTLHRPNNVDDRAPMSSIMDELRKLAERVPIVFPMHPRTRARLAEFGIRCDASPRLKLIEPIGYHDSLCLTESAAVVVTDSGGLQEESTYFRTPCLTLRPNTERPATITLGSNRLTTIETLAADVAELLNKPGRRGTVPPLWDGKTAARILESLRRRTID